MKHLIVRIYRKIRKFTKQKRLHKKMQAIYQKNGKIEVVRGPFKGMVYPDFLSAGSSLYPKLSGIYEKEIQFIFDTVKLKKYRYILDIGCAEGYYAVGLKRIMPGADVYAFDIDARAQKLCRNMADVNNVTIHIEGECSVQRLIKLCRGGVGLVISDCEGAERDLFTRETAKELCNCDFIIEVHDWLQYETPTLDILIENFEETHEHMLVYGIDDYEKVYRYKVDEFKELSLEEKYMMMEEQRRRLGEWLYFTPKDRYK